MGIPDLNMQLEGRLARIGAMDARSTSFEERLDLLDSHVAELQSRGGSHMEEKASCLEKRIADINKLDNKTQLADRLADLAARVTEVASSDRKAELEKRLTSLDARVAEMGHELLMFVEERLGAMDADVSRLCTERHMAAATQSDLLQRICTVEACVAQAQKK